MYTFMPDSSVLHFFHAVQKLPRQYDFVPCEIKVLFIEERVAIFT